MWGLEPVKQVPELVTLARYRASIWDLLEAENSLFEPPVPFQGCCGMLRIDLPVQLSKVALGAGG